jgi:hypothetical protein
LVVSPESGSELLRFDEELNKLAQFDSRKAKVVELRYFGGLKGAPCVEHQRNKQQESNTKDQREGIDRSFASQKMLARPVLRGFGATCQMVFSASRSSTTTEDAPKAKVIRPRSDATMRAPGL